jgi:hypothetical protein
LFVILIISFPLIFYLREWMVIPCETE